MLVVALDKQESMELEGVLLPTEAVAERVTAKTAVQA
jgi:hypothetical protein